MYNAFALYSPVQQLGNKLHDSMSGAELAFLFFYTVGEVELLLLSSEYSAKSQRKLPITVTKRILHLHQHLASS